MRVTAGVSLLEAKIGAFGLAFGVYADFEGLFVVYTGHMFHFAYLEYYITLSKAI